MNRFVALVSAGLACFALSAHAVPDPVVTGPIASSTVPGSPTKDYIFFATDHPLAVNGFIEQEFFV